MLKKLSVVVSDNLARTLPRCHRRPHGRYLDNARVGDQLARFACGVRYSSYATRFDRQKHSLDHMGF
jgi:hypothetical protein